MRRERQRKIMLVKNIREGFLTIIGGIESFKMTFNFFLGNPGIYTLMSDNYQFDLLILKPFQIRTHTQNERTK